MTSWSNFEELKKFTRKSGNVKKKRPESSIGWQKPSGKKRRQTNNDSLCFVSNSESVSEIEGFSTDEEREDELPDSDSDSTFCISRNLSKPCVKRKYSKWRTLLDKKGSAPEDGSLSHADDVPVEKEVQDYRHSDFIPDGAYEMLQSSKRPPEDEIVWRASDEEELPISVSCDGPESRGTVLEARFALENPKQGKVITPGKLNRVQPKNSIPVVKEEAIGDFESDHESSQESLSADISTPTPTPVSPVVVGTPKTASEWLKQVQQTSPQKGEEEQSPEGKSFGLNCDSAKKKRKFVRSGLAQQLQHVISRESSEKAFWNHRVADTEKNPVGTSLQTDGCLVVQIISDQLQASVHLTQCLLFSNDANLPTQRLLFVLFSCETWKQFAVHVGSIVNIHPPWQRLDIAGCPSPVLLCTNFCEKQLTSQDHLPAMNLQSIKGGFFIPLHRESSSSRLHRSPKKDFKPSKLFFENNEDVITEQSKTAGSSLHTVQPVQPARPGNNSCKPETSILNAVECSGGCSGSLVTVQCLVQRVYCRKAKLSKHNNKTYRCSLLNQQLKSQARSVNDIGNEEVRWTLLVQDVHSMCAEIQVPPHFQDSADWKSCIANGEGQVFMFSNVRVTQRTNRVRSAGLFSVIQSLWCSIGETTAKDDNRDSQIVTQESESQQTSCTNPSDFCYLLSVQESSHASLCQETDDWRALGLLYKPCAFKTLTDVLQDKVTQRVNTFCKLLYCRLIGSSVADHVHDSSFEMFVTDSSLQNATESKGRPEVSLSYVKVIGKSCHMLPPELRRVRTNYGKNLSAKLLLLKAQASHELVADSYSVIRKAVSQSATDAYIGFHEENIQGDILKSLDSLRTTCLPSLTLHSCLGYIYLVQGCITGVDEETACCWLVCDTCGNPDITIQHEANSQYFCSSCDRTVDSPKTRTHLAVLVEVKSAPEAQVKVKLQQSTIDKLLPVSYQDSDQGYDIEAVLGKQLERMSCYVTELSKEENGSLARSSFTLEQIQIQ